MTRYTVRHTNGLFATFTAGALVWGTRDRATRFEYMTSAILAALVAAVGAFTVELVTGERR